MDGPNVDWKMLDLIVEDRNTNETSKFAGCGKRLVNFKCWNSEKNVSMLATTVAKIQERSPPKYNFARKLASLVPRVMVSNQTKL